MVSAEYAKALFELSSEIDKVEKIGEELRVVYKTSFKDEDCYNVMTSPFISKTNKKDIITNVYKGKVSDIVINFMYVLIDHDRFNLLREIRHQYNDLIREESRILKVMVKSAKKLTEKQIEEIRASLKHRYKKQTLDIESVVDEELLGGLQITVDDEVIDLSLKASLQRLKESL